MAKDYSKTHACGHCRNISKMEIIGTIADDNTTYDVQTSEPNNGGTQYSVLKCPACSENNIVSYYWHDYMESEDDITYEQIHPKNEAVPLGLPDHIRKAYEAAHAVKAIDVNAYAIMMRRMLELVCIDRKSDEKMLARMLKQLAERKELPEKLVKVAEGLKHFGNIGAHAGTGELGKEEIPLLQSLSNAILGYLYTSPYLAEVAEQKLKLIKN